MKNLYNNAFYDKIREGCKASAAVVAPKVLQLVGPVHSVIDVGCGEGWWAQAFHDLGVARAVGLDGDYVKDAPGAPDVERRGVDLSQSFYEMGQFDLAVSLEVAEHLPVERAVGFVEDLCRLADSVLFSAAIPRQGGSGHVNCEPPGYWAALFDHSGFACRDEVRWEIWDEPNVEPWYKSAIMIYERRTGLNYATTDPKYVIHPDLWLDRR